MRPSVETRDQMFAGSNFIAGNWENDEPMEKRKVDILYEHILQ